MHSLPPRPRRALAVALLVLVAAPGCALFNNPAKPQAVKTITEMNAAVVSRDEAYLQSIETLVRQLLEAKRSELRARWNAKRAEKKLELFVRAERQLAAQRQTIQADLEKALDPILLRLKNEVAAERAKGGASNERETALALQLSATLATAQREALKIEEKAQTQLLAERTRLIDEIDAKFALPAELSASVSDKEVKEILDPVRKQRDAFAAEWKKTTDTMVNYVQAKTPIELTIKGLVGDQLFALIEPKLTGHLAASENAVLTRLGESIAGAASAIEKFGATRTSNSAAGLVTRAAAND